MTKTINLKKILLATKYFDCEPKHHELESILYAMRKACDATAEACSEVADAGPWSYETVQELKTAILDTKKLITDGKEND